MNSKIDYSLINIKDLNSGKLKTLLPEVYDLQNIIEINPWHDHQDVFSHTLLVLTNIDKIIRHYRNKYEFDKDKINLLKIAALFHDIAKKDTIININGLTNTPFHEIKGAEKSANILRRLKINKEHINYVENIINNHDKLHLLLNTKGQKFEDDLIEIRKKYQKIYTDLLILAYADVLGSYLHVTNPEDYKYRINFFKKELDKIYG